MPFNDSTRRKIIKDVQQATVSGATLTWQLPRVGMLARVYLAIRGTINTVTSGPNALGQASIISRVRLQVNSGIDLVNISGAGYHYLLRPNLDFPADPVPQATGRSAVASSAAVNLDMVIPVAINLRDPVGLIMMQNEQTLVTLKIDCNTDASIASGGITWTTRPTVTPYYEVYTVPANQADWPNLRVVHQILEDTQAVAASGDFTYAWPRGNTYVQVLQGLGFAQSGSDGFSNVKVRVNQSDYLQDTQTDYLDIVQAFTRAQQRIAGTIPIDLVSTSGLGTYDLLRDSIDSRWVTDLSTVITATGAGTLYTVRRQLVPVA